MVLFRSGQSIQILKNFAAVHEAVHVGSDLHGAIVILIDFEKAYDTLQRPYLLSALTWLKCWPHFCQLWQHYTGTNRAIFS